MSNHSVLIVGKTGQLARALKEQSRQHSPHAILCLGRPELNICDPKSIVHALEKYKPTAIVNTAAYTAVDLAEDDKQTAFDLNAAGAGELARQARSFDIPLLHISTDFVFDGQKKRPYSETSTTNPLSVYGASKLAGEVEVLAAAGRSCILRTSWIFSPFGKNFVKTIIRLANTKDEISVVSDQVGNPSNALHIADAIFLVVAALCDNRQFDEKIIHYAGANPTTWYEFACEIIQVSKALGGPTAKILPIPSQDYPTAAARPKNSSLDTSKFENIFDRPVHQWKTALSATVLSAIGELDTPSISSGAG